MQFTPVLALHDPFAVDVPLNLDVIHSLFLDYAWLTHNDLRRGDHYLVVLGYVGSGEDKVAKWSF